MRTVARLVTCSAGAVALLAAAALPAAAAGIPPASAGSAVTVHVALAQSDWYWREQKTDLAGQGISPPQALPDQTVPAGDLAVAGPEGPTGNGSETGPDKATFLGFDVTSIPRGSTITAFRISLPVDPSSGAQQVNPTSTDILACASTSGWSGGAGADSFSGKPSDSCTATSPKVTTPDKGKTFAVDIASIAQAWVAPGALNLGVGITDSPTNTTAPYQVVFGPKSALEKLTASVTYLPPAPVVVATASAAAPAPPANAPPAIPSAAGGGTVSSGGGVLPGPVPTVPASTTTATTTAAGPAPVVAPTTAPRALTLAATSALPGAGFWVVAGLLFLLLLAVSLVLGDARVPVRTNRDRGVSRALRGRHSAARGRRPLIGLPHSAS
ncbi:MAG TPA: hypothetical protein VNG13_10785 [Mycobacteriales bacterium]|nr:hypothetical protein [Mycobacteriales bacterium]